MHRNFLLSAFATATIALSVPEFMLTASAQTESPNTPLKVFILAGQSNMQGHGRISLGKDGDLDYTAKQDRFAYLGKDGDWAERSDVWYYHLSGKGELSTGGLKPGQGANETSVGPELAFGHVLGEHFDEQVLLIKCAWGGQAIAMTFRPPSSGLPQQELMSQLFERAKKKNSDLTMDEFKRLFGMRYRQTLQEVEQALANLEKHFPEYNDQGYEIAGFFWHQGWNDGTRREFAEEYESNMVNFIEDMRKDLGNEKIPFVIATSGMGGPDATGVAGYLAKSIEPAQMAAAKQSENCVAIPTRHFQLHQPGRQKSHWYNSAESYCLVGDAAAKAMIELVEGR
ncbi:MAG: sialate O-acetylesterase [Planctomycetota bacterium]